jgi:tungstate transport system ATP-binding protein
VYELATVQVRFGPRVALDIDHLSIAGGCLNILVGPNGSGKSTLLGLLAFLTKPDRGRVTFGGSPVKWNSRELAHLRKQVTLLHQESYLFSGSVMANVAFGLRLRGMDHHEMRCSAQAALSLVGLEGFEDRDAGGLSGGEARRVALARALALRPQILLLDEPLAHVDHASAEIIEKLITARSAAGLTIVMASHDEQIQRRLPSRLIRLNAGRVSRQEPTL